MTIDVETGLEYNPLLLYVLIIVFVLWSFPERLAGWFVAATIVGIMIPQFAEPAFYQGVLPALDLLTEIITIVLLTYALTRFRDATVRLLQDQRQRNHSKRAFVATLSHEFRTPLTAIDGHAQQLLAGDADVARRAGRIRHAVARIQRIVDSILLFDRIESALLIFEPRASDLAGLVHGCCRREQELHPDREIRLDLARLPPIIECDARLIEHLIDNLITNAVKYSAAPAPVEVTGGCDGRFATVAVRDAGVGIPDSEIGQVFGLYFRASNARAIGGFGIGLHVALSIARQHGGDISVASRAGKGSTFTVRLPVIAVRSRHEAGAAA